MLGSRREAAMAIYQTARFQVQAEHLAEARQAIEEFVRYVRDHEPGTRLYSSVHEAEDETTFLHYFIFEDEAAQNLHRASEGVMRFTGILYPTLVDGVQFTEYRLFASTDA
jgi:quinol monooxygenase YgiN